MLTAVGCGVTAISCWVARAEIMAFETNGFSLIDSVGDETERLAEVGKIGRALAAYPELFGEPNLSRPKVAIAVNGWNWALCNAMEGAANHLEYSPRGWHRSIWEAGTPVNFRSESIPRWRALHSKKGRYKR